MNYDNENMVNYVSLCCITCVLMYGKVSLFLSYELTKLYSLRCFISMFYSVTKLAQIGDSSKIASHYHLSFWVSMISKILRIWHV
ncbi:Major capsid [Gossypium arboreum]|uniref:Major capsid n=1 Tax=Gossypium arboreum TaxID=29729 RepID=A0A0B0MVR9_GOSAR|nr:Major capsid [Gossypium arboreum]